MKKLALPILGSIILLCPAGALAQATPAPAPAVLRHLEFKINLHVTESQTSASYDGTSSAMSVGGEEENTSVDVLGLTNDGGMIVRATTQVKGEPRSEAPITCGVYGDGRVGCGPNAEISDTTLLLLQYMGRGFYDPANLVDNQWHHDMDAGNFKVRTTFKRTSADGVNPVRIVQHTDVQPTHDLAAGSTSDTDITYDSALSVPIAIHDTQHTKAHGGSGAFRNTDIQLIKDSFAKP